MNERERKQFELVLRLMLRIRAWHDTIVDAIAGTHAAVVQSARAQWAHSISMLTDEQRAILLEIETEETVRVVEKRQQEEMQCERPN